MWESLHHSGFKQFHAATCANQTLYNHTILVTYVGYPFYLQLSKFKQKRNPCKHQMMRASVSACAYLKMVPKSHELLKTLAHAAVVLVLVFFFFFLATRAVSTLCAGWRLLPAQGRVAAPDAVKSCSTRCLMLRWDLRFEIFVAKRIFHSGTLSPIFFF